MSGRAVTAYRRRLQLFRIDNEACCSGDDDGRHIVGRFRTNESLISGVGADHRGNDGDMLPSQSGELGITALAEERSDVGACGCCHGYGVTVVRTETASGCSKPRS